MEGPTIEPQPLTERLVIIRLPFGLGYIDLIVRIRIIDAYNTRIDSNNWS